MATKVLTLCVQVSLAVTLLCVWRCDAQATTDQSLEWWKSSIVYQIYPRSFKDSDGDGVGDLNGIISKLDYFNYLGVDAVWLSPVYKSPMRDFGYDVADFTDIDPIFGTIQDFDVLIQEAHDKNLSLIMDFVPGHTSTDHVWFQKSVRREGKYTNYFIWDDGIVLANGTRAPPNNWLSVFGGSAWAWNDVRQQYYYHAFIPEQADLNHRDPNVEWEMKEVLRYWLDKGVDGFRLDAIAQLFEVTNLTWNEPRSGLNVTPFEFEYLDHIYTANQPETIPTLTKWHQLMDEYRQKDGKDRYMVIEIYDDVAVRNKLFATGGNPFNMELVSLTGQISGFEVRDKVKDEYDNLPSGQWPNFVLGNHDRYRVSQRFGSQYVDVFNMLLLTLWGTPTTYYGEELGMLAGIISWEQTVDPWGRNFGPTRYQEFSRDPERTPMQWTGGYQAGFTTGNTTWLPLAENYTTLNVQTERDSMTQTSLKLYRDLAYLRKKPVFQSGTFKVGEVSQEIFSFLREGDSQKYLVAMNVGQQEATTDFTLAAGDTSATVIAITPSLSLQNYQKNQVINLDAIKLRPGDGLVLEIKAGGAPAVG